MRTDKVVQPDPRRIKGLWLRVLDNGAMGGVAHQQMILHPGTLERGYLCAQIQR